ncbi:unnamed protein product [Rhizoctonia solani]|uniref:Uncharacterized protein n=1 Tax=Rhizoctonia solani TaxID=456999 RepID=A0A8H2Y2Q2_9AGAM|nr:unnamed protein product [Rhizoctonia solani]
MAELFHAKRRLCDEYNRHMNNRPLTGPSGQSDHGFDSFTTSDNTAGMPQDTLRTRRLSSSADGNLWSPKRIRLSQPGI